MVGVHEQRKRQVSTIIGLGPSLVKVAQVFALRSDLIPEPYLGERGGPKAHVMLMVSITP